MSKKNEKKPSPIKRLFSSRNTRQGAVSVAVTAAIIAAVILLNAVIAIIASRTPLYLDVTANRNYKLQSVTVDYIRSLDKDVDIYVLAEESNFDDFEAQSNYDIYQYYVQANRLLHEFENNSDKIHLHYVNTDKNPTFLQKYKNINRSDPHMILIECGDNYNVLDAQDLFSTTTDSSTGTTTIYSQHVEQAVVSSILKAADDKHITVTVADGLGSGDCSAFTARLSMNAYDIENVNLSVADPSEESRFIIIFMPEADIDEATFKKLSDWLYNDGQYGHNIIYFPNDYIDAAQFANLNALLSDYGMAIDYGYIFEENTEYLIPGADINLNTSLFDYADVDFTANLTNPSKKVIMGEYGTLSIDILDSSVASSMLVSSSDVSLYDIKAKELKEAEGPLCGAAVGRKGGSSGVNSSVVTIGSSFAVSNLYLTAKSYNNEEYFINMFNVLADNDVSIIIEGKDPTSTELGVDSQKDVQTLQVLVVYIIPGLVLIAGLIIWFRRRHK